MLAEGAGGALFVVDTRLVRDTCFQGCHPLMPNAPERARVELAPAVLPTAALPVGPPPGESPAVHRCMGGAVSNK